MATASDLVRFKAQDKSLEKADLELGLSLVAAAELPLDDLLNKVATRWVSLRQRVAEPSDVA